MQIRHLISRSEYSALQRVKRTQVDRRRQEARPTGKRWLRRSGAKVIRIEYPDGIVTATSSSFFEREELDVIASAFRADKVRFINNVLVVRVDRAGICR